MVQRITRETLAAAALIGLACTDSPATPPDGSDSTLPVCALATEFLVNSPVGRDGIPSLQNPEFVSAEPNEKNAYLSDDDRVLGFFLGGEPMAIPHNILWYHEIVNLDRGEERIAITYCPLTGSPLGFDRNSISGNKLGISGLLFMNNLIMYNRGQPESFFPQMMGRAQCGAEVGRTLDRAPLFEMTWLAWRRLYPTTTVVSSDVNISRNYAVNPYGDYDSLDNEHFLYANMPPLDRRRPAKERVLGLPSMDGESGIAFPYLALENHPGSWTTLRLEWNALDLLLLWSDRNEGGGIFHPRDPTTGQELTFRVDALRGLVDDQTETRWSVAGEGLDGPLSGVRLEPVAEAYVAFWGAWAAFHPETRLWEGV